MNFLSSVTLDDDDNATNGDDDDDDVGVGVAGNNCTLCCGSFIV